MTPRRADRERGSVSLFAVVAVMALFMAIGLVVDGGGKMRSSQHADSVAAEAARAGAQAITSDTLIHGTPPRVDATRAAAAANTYLSAAGVQGAVQISGSTITVTTSATYTPVFLGAIGVGAQHVSGRATVDLIRGP